MKKYQGKILIIVNGLRIAAFPCNQFGKQEPKSEEEIKKFATERYGVTFDMYSKIDVNDANEHPLWHFLKSKLSGTTGTPIKWNFAKFLIDQNGVPVRRYEPDDSPNSMEPDFTLLNKWSALPRRFSKQIVRSFTDMLQRNLLIACVSFILHQSYCDDAKPDSQPAKIQPIKCINYWPVSVCENYINIHGKSMCTKNILFGRYQCCTSCAKVLKVTVNEHGIFESKDNFKFYDESCPEATDRMIAGNSWTPCIVVTKLKWTTFHAQQSERVTIFLSRYVLQLSKEKNFNDIFSQFSRAMSNRHGSVINVGQRMLSKLCMDGMLCKKNVNKITERIFFKTIISRLTWMNRMVLSVERRRRRSFANASR
ncbi:Glutathione peroxidase [Trichinella spiralis]|uniref:Glutathione peroxidase n=1 Tax=Trichinella spiralis TaxID=6334 RepID=A0ABR3KR61_TRISP